MKTVIVAYEAISPAVLAQKVEYWFPGCACRWKDIDEDFSSSLCSSSKTLLWSRTCLRNICNIPQTSS